MVLLGLGSRQTRLGWPCRSGARGEGRQGEALLGALLLVGLVVGVLAVALLRVRQELRPVVQQLLVALL